MTVYNQKDFDATKEFMFFGESVNVARYDQQKYPKIDSFTEQQLSFFWRPEEVDVTKDRSDFQRMKPHEQHIFTSNLKYQTLLDSVQGRAPTLAFLPIVSIPELETWIETWAFSETIHSRSYTHIIRNVYNDPSEVFDTIVSDPHIAARATAVTYNYDRLIDSHTDGTDLYQRKVNLFKTMVTTYALEAIRFYVSFACSFAFAEREMMEGNAKIIKLIARDEHLHKGGTHFILTRWLHGFDDPEMTQIARDHVWYIEETLKKVGLQEKMWADHLFKDGSLVGLNKDICYAYIDYLIQKCLFELLVLPVGGVTRDFGVKVDYKPNSNPIPWIDSNWLSSNKVQVAPQETEIESYLVGQVDNNVTPEFMREMYERYGKHK